MAFAPLGRGPHWPPDYRSYAVELYRQKDAGVVTAAEAECRLANKFPNYELPDERTWRRWAREKYPDLPEQRRQFFTPQEVDGEFDYQPIASGCYEVQGSFAPSVSWVATQPVLPTQVNFYQSMQALMEWLVFDIILGMWTAMVRMVNSSL
jgi:hypothetical protein